MSAMSYRDMANLMQMDDREKTGRVLLDQLEWRGGSGEQSGFWEGNASYGDDYNKVLFRTEGRRTDGFTEDARAELFWDHIITRWWNTHVGVRQDFGDGPPRTWGAAGLEGLSAYWFNIEATAYVGEQSRTAARFRAEYELLFTQRLILQPEFEANWYGKSDPERGLGSGISGIDLGLRLRYEFRREFAPYIGVAWLRRYGETADFAGARGQDASEVQFVAGLRLWF